MAEMQHLLEDARGEIIRQRRTNEIQSAKLEVFEVFAPLVRLLTQNRNTMMCEDVVGKLDKKIEELRNPPQPLEVSSASRPDRSPIQTGEVTPAKLAKTPPNRPKRKSKRPAANK